ncbi:MAG: SHOCT domain-containing protein [Draconibacterium sp.]|nr:SHOCT domain-containing protein [Draconibacterium sp.]
MMEEMNNIWGMGHGYGWIIGLIVLVVIIAVIVSAMKHKRKSLRPKYNSPQDILKTRYAKGEISKDEYDEKRNHIT